MRWQQSSAWRRLCARWAAPRVVAVCNWRLPCPLQLVLPQLPSAPTTCAALQALQPHLILFTSPAPLSLAAAHSGPWPCFFPAGGSSHC